MNMVILKSRRTLESIPFATQKRRVCGSVDKVEASQGHVGPPPPEADSKYKFGLKHSVAWPESYVPHMLWGPHRKPGPQDLPPLGYYGSQDWNQRKRAPLDSFTYLWTGFVHLPRFEAYPAMLGKGKGKST